MAIQEDQSKNVNPHEGEDVTVVRTSNPVGDVSEKNAEKPVTNMPMSHKDDVFTDWNFAIRG